MLQFRPKMIFLTFTKVSLQHVYDDHTMLKDSWKKKRKMRNCRLDWQHTRLAKTILFPRPQIQEISRSSRFCVKSGWP